MARQSILILGSLCGGGLALSLLAHQLSQPEQVASPQTPQINVPVVSDERPWPPIPTPPPPLPSPQPRPSGSLPIPVPIPRTEGVSRFENGRITDPALYQAAVDAFVAQIQDSGYTHSMQQAQGILIALPDGTQLASFQADQSYGSPMFARLVTSVAALGTWGSRPEAISLLPLLQEMHLRVGDPNLLSDRILTGLTGFLSRSQYPNLFLEQSLPAALAEMAKVQPQPPLNLVATPQSLMRILYALEQTRSLGTVLPSQAQPQMVMEQGPAKSLLSSVQGESHVMAGQLPDGTLFVLFNTGSSQQQIQQLQHRLLNTLATLRQ